MDLDKYKRDYRYKSSEGNKSFKWIIIVGAVVIALIAYFLK
jgi:hypothetical protein